MWRVYDFTCVCVCIRESFDWTSKTNFWLCHPFYTHCASCHDQPWEIENEHCFGLNLCNPTAEQVNGSISFGLLFFLESSEFPIKCKNSRKNIIMTILNTNYALRSPLPWVWYKNSYYTQFIQQNVYIYIFWCMSETVAAITCSHTSEPSMCQCIANGRCSMCTPQEYAYMAMRNRRIYIR